MQKIGAGFILMLASYLLLVLFQEIGVAKADTTISIKSYGDLESTDVIEHSGNVYTVTGNMYSLIVIERNNIVLDGGGYALEGPKSGIAINLTATNMTVKNLNIMDWHTAVLGAYNNNTILGNMIMGCSFSIKIYADQYRVIENHIVDNGEGIRLCGGLNVVSHNNISNNDVGLRILSYAYHLENVITENLVAHNEKGMYLFWNQMGIYQKIYRNNFINNTEQILIPSPFVSTAENPIGVRETACNTWNEDYEGNYWSNYNGADINGDGVGDTAYIINELDKDSYPLMASVGLATVPEFSSCAPLLIMLLSVTLITIICRKAHKLEQGKKTL